MWWMEEWYRQGSTIMITNMTDNIDDYFAVFVWVYQPVWISGKLLLVM
jgi:hypothetical protein